MLPLAVERKFLSYAPSPNKDQIVQFETQPLLSSQIGIFKPLEVAHIIAAHEGDKVLCVDIGGKKISAQTYVFRGGRPHASGNAQITSGERGIGYLPFLEDVRDQAGNTPIAVSAAGLIRGSSLEDSMNLDLFIREFERKYGKDFLNVFPTFACLVNDCVASTIGGAIYVLYDGMAHTDNLLSIVNGGGLGSSILIDNKLITVESGHTKLTEGLNPHHQEKRCGGNCNTDGVCVKNVVASGSGIEDIYYKKTGEMLTGNEISARAVIGDELALQLYLNSADVLAHLIIGISKRFGMADEDGKQPTVLCHGGCFQFSQYGEALDKFIERYTGNPADLIFTRHFSENACMDGAAVASLLES